MLVVDVVIVGCSIGVSRACVSMCVVVCRFGDECSGCDSVFAVFVCFGVPFSFLCRVNPKK